MTTDEERRVKEEFDRRVREDVERLTSQQRAAREQAEARQREAEAAEAEAQRMRERSDAEAQSARQRAEAAAAEARRAQEELRRAQERTDELVREAAANPMSSGDPLQFPRPQWLADCGAGRVNIAFCGQRGTGKSTLINTARGLVDSDDGAAPTDSAACTGVRTAPQVPYRDSRYPAVLWDLAGIDAAFPRQTYIRDMGLRWMHVVVVVTGLGLSQDDVELIKQLRICRVPWFLVRSKLDSEVEAERRRSRGRGAAEGIDLATYRRLQDTLVGQLKAQLPDSQAERVFVVSGWNTGLGGWDALWQAILRDLRSQIERAQAEASHETSP
eukprot:m51a1_g2121 hypothetical protein (329) ;mRNA; f:1667208-1668371